MSLLLVARRLLVVGLLASPAVVSVGCKPAPPAERTVPVSNSGFQLEQLFTDDRGYTVYRFYDKADWRYYVVGPHGEAQMLPSTTRASDASTGVYVGTGIGVGVGGDVHGGHHH